MACVGDVLRQKGYEFEFSQVAALLEEHMAELGDEGLRN